MPTVGTHQHYVPQFVLRGFASGRSHQLDVFDKVTGKSFKTAARNVASENGFYDADIDGIPCSLDPFFSKVEELAKDAIKKIRSARSVRDLGDEEKASIAAFVTVQLLRTNAQRRQFRHVNDLFRDAIIQRGGDPNNLRNFKVLDDTEARIVHMQLIPDLARDLAPHLINKSWLLYSAPQSHSLYIVGQPCCDSQYREPISRSRHRGPCRAWG